MASFCAAEPTHSILPADLRRIGEVKSGARDAAVGLAAIVEARLGRLDAALALVDELDPPGYGPVSGRTGYEAMVVAIAGDPSEARRLAEAFIVEAARASDVVWHGELVLVLGIIHLRRGEAPNALTYFEAAKRSPRCFMRIGTPSRTDTPQRLATR